MGLAKIVKDGYYENQHLVREVTTLKNNLKLFDDGAFCTSAAKDLASFDEMIGIDKKGKQEYLAELKQVTCVCVG